MALTCAVSLNYTGYTAGQTPPPMATVTVGNAQAVAVTVTGMQLTAHMANNGIPNRLAMPPSSPPIGPGMTVTVPAGGSITIGPFPVVVGSAAYMNSQAVVNQSGNLFPQDAQPSQPPQSLVMVGAIVNGSDGSSNVAAEVGLLVSYASPPPLGYQGGFFNFAGPNNLQNALVAGVL